MKIVMCKGPRRSEHIRCIGCDTWSHKSIPKGVRRWDRKVPGVPASGKQARTSMLAGMQWRASLRHQRSTFCGHRHQRAGELRVFSGMIAASEPDQFGCGVNTSLTVMRVCQAKSVRRKAQVSWRRGNRCVSFANVSTTLRAGVSDISPLKKYGKTMAKMW